MEDVDGDPGDLSVLCINDALLGVGEDGSEVATGPAGVVEVCLDERLLSRPSSSLLPHVAMLGGGRCDASKYGETCGYFSFGRTCSGFWKAEGFAEVGEAKSELEVVGCVVLVESVEPTVG